MKEKVYKKNLFGFIVSLIATSCVIIFCVFFFINQWDELLQTPVVIFIILVFFLVFTYMLISTIKSGLSILSLTPDGIAFNLKNGAVYLVSWDKIEEINNDQQHSFLGRDYTDCKRTFLSKINTEEDRSIIIFFSDNNDIVYQEHLCYGDITELKGTNRRAIRCLSTINPVILAKDINAYWHSINNEMQANRAKN